MGYIAFFAGTSTRLYDVAYKFLGRVEGGLAMATIGACTAFGAICGSATATAATMGTIALPEMKRYGYAPELSTGSVAAGGTLGALMPPSVVLIVYGIATQQSIGKLFIAGIVPAVIMTIFFLIVISVFSRMNPEQGPAGEKFSLRQMMGSLLELWETVLVFFFVMGGMFFRSVYTHESRRRRMLLHSHHCHPPETAELGWLLERHLRDTEDFLHGADAGGGGDHIRPFSGLKPDTHGNGRHGHGP